MAISLNHLNSEFIIIIRILLFSFSTYNIGNVTVNVALWFKLPSIPNILDTQQMFESYKGKICTKSSKRIQELTINFVKLNDLYLIISVVIYQEGSPE